MQEKLLLYAILVCSFCSFAFAQVTSSEALQRLVDGNKRLTSETLRNDDRDTARIKELAHGQHPFAIIVSCSDSRVPPEVIFDQGLGNLFVIRLAGEVVDSHALGSVEYAAKYLKAPLILVLGHSECGAVHAAIEGKDYGPNINSIVAKIMPAVEEARKMSGDLMENSVIQNVLLVESELRNDPELIRLMDQEKLQIFSGVYDLESGEVEIFAD